MSCNCVSGCDADEMIDVICQETRKARKVTKCYECHEAIQVGQEHEYIFGKFEGEDCTYRTCLPCVEIRGHFSDGSWVFGSVWEDLQECFFPTMTAGGPCMEGLSAAAKGKLFAEWRKWKGLEE